MCVGSSADLKTKAKRALKAVMVKCTDGEALAPLLKDADPKVKTPMHVPCPSHAFHMLCTRPMPHVLHMPYTVTVTATPGRTHAFVHALVLTH